MEQVMQNENFNKFAIPLRMGIVTALVLIILSTIQNQFFLGSFMGTMGFMAISFIIGVGMVAYAGVEQRKALGGYMDIKQAFQAVFVASLIICVATGVYGIIYAKFIDPAMFDKVQESAMAAAEKWGAPQESLDKMTIEFEEQRKGMDDIGKILFGLAKSIVIYGIVSFIIAAIVKKNRPPEATAV